MRAERNREWPWRGRAVGREERSRKPYSVIVLGIGPGRQACHHIELPQQAAHQLVRIVFRAEILELIRSLPDAYRETLVLRLVEGMTGPEIAARTGLTAASVRVNLHRGMKLLRERLGIMEGL